MAISNKVIQLHQKGYNILPLQRGSKDPVRGVYWKKFQYLRQNYHDLLNLFSDHDGNIGIICGEVSGNLVVLDCDTNEIFDFLQEKLSDYPVKLVSSSRGGHIYLKTDIPVKSHVAQTPYGKVEVRSTGLYVVAEDSIHPNGTVYQVMQEVDELPIFKLGTLPGIDFITFEAEMNETSVESIMRESGLLERVIKASYKSRSEADMAVITFLIRKGYKKESIGYFLLKSGHDSKYVDLLNKNSSRAAAWLDLSIKKASGLENSTEFNKTQDDMKALKDLLVRSPLEGSRGAALYKVLLAHLSTSEASGKAEYHLSVRSASEKVGVSHVTFMKHNKWLLNRKFILPIKQSAGVSGNIYKVDVHSVKEWLESKNVQNFTTQSINTVTNCETYGALGLFERNSYGHSANQIFNAIASHDGLKISELSEITGRSVNTVRRVCEKLEQAGLLKKEAKKFFSTGIDLKEFSIDNEFIAKSVKRRYTHMCDRIKFRTANYAAVEEFVG